MSSYNPLQYLRKESLDVYNRLHSIQEDSRFVDQIHDAYPQLPLLPNLRCGAWYTNPAIASDVPAYFKSTDGHFNNWGFNLRRANLHLLPLILNSGGVILVDSTRSGKKIPDALSKTVPIWCAVVNRATVIRHQGAFQSEQSSSWNAKLYTPPGSVSVQEHHQIELRLDAWAQSLANSSFNLPLLPCPLRPLWITPATSNFPSLPSPPSPSRINTETFLPVICLSASKQIDQGVERRTSGFSYVQGSGDDHELWGMGLTPSLFWRHHTSLLEAGRSALPQLISSLVSQTDQSRETSASQTNQPTPIIQVQGLLLLAQLNDLPSLHVLQREAQDSETAYILLTPSAQPQPRPSDTISDTSVLVLSQIQGKKGQSHFLDYLLPNAIPFLRKCLSKRTPICIACEDGKDQSVGIALVALQLFFSDDGALTEQADADDHIKCDKKTIRTRLEWIISSRPTANPSRATLKRVNEYLLSPPSFKLKT